MIQSLLLPFRGVMPRVDPTAYIAPGAILIGDVVIGAESSVWPGCVLRADMGPIRIGMRTNIQDGVIMHATAANQGGQGVFVGDGVTIGHNAILHDCVVEDGAFVGMRATMMDGSRVESEGMLAAAGLLTPGKLVSKGQVWAGNPAKYWRDVTDEERSVFLGRAAEYVELAKTYRL